MPTYRYQGHKIGGGATTGSIEAPTAELAAEALMGRGIIPTSIEAGKAKAMMFGSGFDWRALLQPAVPLEVLVIFCRQLYSLTKAGVPLLRAMRGLTQNCQDKQLQKALEDVSSELTNGRSLSAAMQRHSGVFSSLFVSLINVGENTGRLDEALLQLSQYYEQEVETRKRIKSAMRYPLFVIAFVMIAMFILNLKVIPQFASMFQRFGAELPLPTRILLSTSEFFVHYWGWMLAIIAGVIFAVRSWIGTESGRERWDHFRLRMPIVGDIINRAQLSRFSRTFSLMLRAGVPLNQALSLSAEALQNKFLEKRLLEMKSSIESGSSLSQTATNAKIFTPLVLQMLLVGEETGQIDELLMEVSDFYDREVDYDLKTLTARIEPILLVLVAAMVLVLALGIFMPMWGMMDAIKGR